MLSSSVFFAIFFKYKSRKMFLSTGIALYTSEAFSLFFYCVLRIFRLHQFFILCTFA